MVKVNRVGLSVLASSQWTVSSIVAHLSAVEAGIVRVPGSLGHSPLITSLMPSSLASSSSPVGWGVASG